MVALCGCSGPDYGPRLLDDLRAEGLIHDRGAEVTPSLELEIPADPIDLQGSGELSLEMLFAIAEERHPRLAAARASIGAAGGRAWQATLPPNPSVEIESENVRPSNGGLGVSDTTVSLSQPIVTGQRRQAAAAAGQADIARQRLAVEEIRREIHARIRRVAAEITFDRAAIAHYERLIEVASETLRIAEARLEAGAAPETEAIRARVEVNSITLALQRLRGSLAVAAEELKTSLGGVALDIDRLPVSTLQRDPARSLRPLDEIDAAVRGAHPAILAARWAIESARRQVDVEKSLSRPDWTARFGVGVSHADDEGFVEGGLSAPLTIFDRNQGRILAARFEVIRWSREAEAIENDIAGSLAQAYRRWESARAGLIAFEAQILSGAQQAYDQTVIGYEAGRLPLLDVLDAQRTLIEATLSQLELGRAVSLALSEVDQITGGPIESSTQPQTGEVP